MHPQELKRAYDGGQNISILLKDAQHTKENTEEIIELAYDLQTGSYVEILEYPLLRRQKVLYGEAIAAAFRELGEVDSLFEAGVGEATTLSHVLDALPSRPQFIFGADLAWSRVRCARNWLQSGGTLVRQFVSPPLRGIEFRYCLHFPLH
jgi:hypothetical protein